MSSQSKMIQIRSRKLGVLIYDSRKAAHRSVGECAQAIGVPEEGFAAYENGSASPSLPQLEMLAVFLSVPIEHFWGSQSLLKEFPDQTPEEKGRMLVLRNRVIGASLRLSRDKAGLSLEEVSERTSISADDLKRFELGEQAVPVPMLERLAEIYQIPITSLYDQHGPISKMRAPQAVERKQNDLPDELQKFIAKPVNLPYLEIALRLSEMPVDKLRTLAESLLEITF